MKKYSLFIIIVVMLLANSAFAFSPSPEQERWADEQAKLCESTGGAASIKREGGYDPKTGIDRAWSISANCNCPEGYNWNSTAGCVKVESSSIQTESITVQTQDTTIQKQAISTSYFEVGILFAFISAIFWVLRKK